MILSITTCLCFKITLKTLTLKERDGFESLNSCDLYLLLCYTNDGTRKAGDEREKRKKEMNEYDTKCHVFFLVLLK